VLRYRNVTGKRLRWMAEFAAEARGIVYGEEETVYFALFPCLTSRHLVLALVGVPGGKMRWALKLRRVRCAEARLFELRVLKYFHVLPAQ
jgi:hypothetical protein